MARKPTTPEQDDDFDATLTDELETDSETMPTLDELNEVFDEPTRIVIEDDFDDDASDVEL